MKKHVPKRSLCKKLPKSFKTDWMWHRHYSEPIEKGSWSKKELKDIPWYPAPLADELMRELLKKIDITIMPLTNGTYRIKSAGFDFCYDLYFRNNKSLPTALCELYLWAVKEGYIKGGKL